MEVELELSLDMDQDYIASRPPYILFPRSDGGESNKMEVTRKILLGTTQHFTAYRLPPILRLRPKWWIAQQNIR